MTHRRVFLLIFLLFFSTSAIFAGGEGNSYRKEETNDAVKKITVGNIKISMLDLSLKTKKKYSYILFDAFPYQKQIQTYIQAKNLSSVARALANAVYFKKVTQVSSVKIDIVEFSEKDSYGEKDWDSVIFKGKFQLTRKNGKIIVESH